MFLIISCVAGSLLIGVSLRLFILGMKSKTWKPVKGKILSQLEIKEAGDASRHRRMNHLMIQYEYYVNGIRYISDRVRFKFNNQNLEEEKKRYQENAIVDVYVNPKNGAQAVLEPGLNATNYLSLVAGLFVLSAGIFSSI